MELKQSGAKQSRAEWSGAEQSRTEQSRAELSILRKNEKERYYQLFTMDSSQGKEVQPQKVGI